MTNPVFNLHVLISYLIREQTISITGPSSPPIKCNSSTMNKLMFCTFFRCFHLLESTSHFSAVVIIICPLARSFKSVPVSPVNSTTFLPSVCPNFTCQSAKINSARASFGTRYTHLPSGFLSNKRRIENSAMVVLPEPVGAPINILSSPL